MPFGFQIFDFAFFSHVWILHENIFGNADSGPRIFFLVLAAGVNDCYHD